MNRHWGWCVFLVAAQAHAQADSTAGHPHAPMHRLTVAAAGAYTSNVLDNALALGLYKGGALGADILSRNREALGGANRAGISLGASATLAWGSGLFGREQWMPRITIAQQYLLGLRFASDAYLLSFFGNTPFEDRTAHLGPSAFEQVNFQSACFGVENRNTCSYLELGVVNGHGLNRAQINQADLFTAPDGRYLELALDGNYQRSDTAGRAASRGIGAIINAQWSRPLQVFKTPAKLTISVHDLGFIAWGPGSLAMRPDSTLRFDGFRVPHILDLANLVVNQAGIQDSLGLGFQRGAFTRLLPFKVEGRLEFGKTRTNRAGDVRSAYALLVDQRALPGYAPHTTILRRVAFSDAFTLSFGADHGGFGGLRVLLGMEACMGRHLTLNLASQQVAGFFSDHLHGMAVQAAVQVLW